jgi:hypothetical protein
MRGYSTPWSFAVYLVCLFFGAPAMGQGDTTCACAFGQGVEETGHSSEIAGWTLVPLLANEVVVRGFVAWPSAPTQSEFTAFWFERGANSVWDVYGWDAGGPGDAIEYIEDWATNLGIAVEWGDDELVLEMLDQQPGSNQSPILLYSDLQPADPWPMFDNQTGLPNLVDVLRAHTYYTEMEIGNDSSEEEPSQTLCAGCKTTRITYEWGDWTFCGSTTTSAGVVVCNYKRCKLRLYAKQGETVIYCDPCNVLSYYKQKEQTGTTRVANAVPCPDPPPATTSSPGSWSPYP